MDAIAGAVLGTVPSSQVVHHGCCSEFELTGQETGRGLWPMVAEFRMPEDSLAAEMDGWSHFHETYRRIDGQ